MLFIVINDHSRALGESLVRRVLATVHHSKEGKRFQLNSSSYTVTDWSESARGTPKQTETNTERKLGNRMRRNQERKGLAVSIYKCNMLQYTQTELLIDFYTLNVYNIWPKQCDNKPQHETLILCRADSIGLQSISHTTFNSIHVHVYSTTVDT